MTRGLAGSEPARSRGDSRGLRDGADVAGSAAARGTLRVGSGNQLGTRSRRRPVPPSRRHAPSSSTSPITCASVGSTDVMRHAAVSSDRCQFWGPLSVFPTGWFTREPLATSVRPARSPMRPAPVVRQDGDQLPSPPNGVNQLAGHSWPAPALTLSPRQGSAPIPCESSAQGCNDEGDFRIPYHPRERPVVIISQIRTSLGIGDAETCRSVMDATLRGEYFR